jgi:hypothetical protein
MDSKAMRVRVLGTKARTDVLKMKRNRMGAFRDVRESADENADDIFWPPTGAFIYS